VPELLHRFRRSFSIPVFVGSPAACLEAVRAKYDSPTEAGRFAGVVETGLSAVEREQLLPRLRPACRVLDIGCGAGREAFGLARAGFHVTGIDLAPKMIEAAREHAARECLPVALRVLSATEIGPALGTFDAVYWSDSYQHVPGRDLRIEALRRVRGALAPEGSWSWRSPATRRGSCPACAGSV